MKTVDVMNSKETDIMDVWFDSGSTYEGVLVERGLPFLQIYTWKDMINIEDGSNLHY